MAVSTRLHGLIDLGVAALLGGVSLSGRLPAPVRRAAAAAGLCRAGYALLTNDEAGLRPVLTMRRHLALEVAGGAAWCGAGVLMRRRPTTTRLALVATGLAGLAVVALSADMPMGGPARGTGPAGRRPGGGPIPGGRAGYPPLDTVKPIAEDIFIVDSLLPVMPGLMLPVRMTVIRLPGGDLLLHSPTRFDQALRHELDGLGRIRHLVAPNVAHWMFLKDWQSACPDATSWAAPGLRDRRQLRRRGVRLDHELGAVAPIEWGGAVALHTVPGGLGFREVALFHRPSRTLVLTDLVLNLESSKLPRLLRPLARLSGATAPDGMPPPYLRAAIKLRRRAAAAAARILIALRPDRVVFAHGRWFDTDGAAALARSLRWLLA